MKGYNIIPLLIGLMLCCAQNQLKPNRSSAPAPSRVILTAELTDQQLLDQLSSYRTGKAAYLPDNEAIAALQSLQSDIHIIIFLGTWCPDSEREVPRFLKIMEQAKGTPITYQLIGLDRSKRDAAGLAERFQIEFVPTFVVLHQNEEIGRIVESASVSLEQDLVEIIISGIGNK